MANCVKCGAPLREGAKFCGACGAKIEAQRFCTQCGEPLAPGEKFCVQCGAPVDGAPAAPRASRVKKPDFPDVRGFYFGQHEVISASDEALVWRNFSTLYRLDRDWDLRSQDLGSWIRAAIQTRKGILVVIQEDMHLILKTLDPQLALLSETPLCELSDKADNHFVFMTQFDLFVLQYAKTFDEDVCHDIPAELSLRWIDLTTGETKRWSWDRLEWNGMPISDIFNIFTSDGKQLYFNVWIYENEEDNPAFLSFDPRTASFSSLWYDHDSDGYSGLPQFFDLEKQLMWTYPTKAELARREDLTKRSLVARKLAPNSRILSAMPVWREGHSTGLFSYFDGQHAYYQPKPKQFCSYTQSGLQSEDWGNGDTEDAFIWPQAGKIVTALTGGGFKIYPLTSAKPDDLESFSPREIN